MPEENELDPIINSLNDSANNLNEAAANLKSAAAPSERKVTLEEALADFDRRFSKRRSSGPLVDAYGNPLRGPTKVTGSASKGEPSSSELVRHISNVFARSFSLSSLQGLARVVSKNDKLDITKAAVDPSALYSAISKTFKSVRSTIAATELTELATDLLSPKQRFNFERSQFLAGKRTGAEATSITSTYTSGTANTEYIKMQAARRYGARLEDAAQAAKYGLGTEAAIGSAKLRSALGIDTGESLATAQRFVRRFGTSENEAIKGLARLSTVANEAGVTVSEVTQLFSKLSDSMQGQASSTGRAALEGLTASTMAGIRTGSIQQRQLEQFALFGRASLSQAAISTVLARQSGQMSGSFLSNMETMLSTLDADKMAMNKKSLQSLFGRFGGNQDVLSRFIGESLGMSGTDLKSINQVLRETDLTRRLGEISQEDIDKKAMAAEAAEHPTQMLQNLGRAAAEAASNLSMLNTAVKGYSVQH